MGRIESRNRNRANRQRKSVVAIGCEGKNKTEKVYFKNFSSRECIIKFSTGNSTDPVRDGSGLNKIYKRRRYKK